MWRIAHGGGKMTYELQTRQKSEKGETAGKHKVLRGFTFQTAFLKKCLGPYYCTDVPESYNTSPAQ